ncbi:ABC-2 family transporter protein [Streptococcus constellatus]|uniref:ABC-2 family transporter protein n=1 Tax=Streptococcus constellatus TaxID=76860 RepID=A0A564S801_STRCV|nr:ABC transporter permease [Streptococcus constellatus]VUW91257.1 ABC-2 family transporter protein [Streptococcus constellatus]VUX08248.1 ABC-2 family transporter protein [Streptococcus gordonii]
MAFFYFELKRFLKNPKNKICLILLSAIFLGLFIFNQTTLNKQITKMNLTTAKFNLQQSKQIVENFQKEVQQNPDNRDIAQQLKNAQVEQKILSEQLSALKKKDIEKFAELENRLNLLQLKSTSKKDTDEYRNLTTKINYYNAIKAAKGNPSTMVNDTNEAAFTIGRSLTAWLSSTTIFVLITVLITDSLSSEIESSQIRFYQLLGGRKFRHLLTKLLVPILVTFLTTLLIFTILYVAKGILDSFGTWQYPYLMTDRTILPIWKISLNTIILFLVALLFIASLGQFFALIFKKSLVVIGLILVFLTSFLTLSQEEWFQPFKKFLPFEYMGYGQLINDSQILPKNAFLIGIVYLLGLSLIFLLASYYLYKNYYYRKAEKA